MYGTLRASFVTGPDKVNVKLFEGTDHVWVLVFTKRRGTDTIVVKVTDLILYMIDNRSEFSWRFGHRWLSPHTILDAQLEAARVMANSLIHVQTELKNLRK